MISLGSGLEEQQVFAQLGIHRGIRRIRRIRCQQLQDGPSPTHAQDGQDEVGLNKLPQMNGVATYVAGLNANMRGSPLEQCRWPASDNDPHNLCEVDATGRFLDP